MWLGVSVENQRFADERIPLLLQTPAAVRFISAEPLLCAIDISRWMWPVHWAWSGAYKSPEEAIAAGAYAEQKRQCLVSAHRRFLDWVIVGGESGRGARPFDVAWARSIVSQCQAAGVPVFVKQLGRHPYDMDGLTTCASSAADPLYCVRCKVRAPSWPLHVGRVETSDSHGGDMAEWPEDLRVREMPCGR